MKMGMKAPIKVLLLMLAMAHAAAAAEGYSVAVEVKLLRSDNQQPLKDLSKSVVWLVPTRGDFRIRTKDDPHFRMVQKGKKFEPDLLIVPAGSFVDFPNMDPWFHNVFSLFQGKRFDLGLYQAGTQRSVRFDRPGVSYLFCNIHPEMSSVVLAVESNWYGTSDSKGVVTLTNVPEGRYVMHVWHENSSAESPGQTQKVIEVTGDRKLSPITLMIHPQNHNHKNKYGNDYDPDALKPEY